MNACAICGSADRRAVYAGRIREGRFGELSADDCLILQCDGCGARALENSRQDLLRFYESDAYRALVDGAAEEAQYYRNHDVEQLRHLTATGTGGFRDKVVADVGCGAGSFLHCVGGMARKVVAIEPSNTFRTALAARGYATYAYAADALVDLNGQVDVAVSFSVVEHVEHPAQFLTEIRQLLRPGSGRLTISTPNAQDALIGMLTEYAQFFYRRAHLWYWTPEALSSLLLRAGFVDPVVVPVQRFGLSNFLAWLRDRSPKDKRYFHSSRLRWTRCGNRSFKELASAITYSLPRERKTAMSGRSIQVVLLTALVVTSFLMPFRLPFLGITVHGLLLLVALVHYAVTDARPVQWRHDWPLTAILAALVLSWIWARGAADTNMIRAVGFGVLTAFLVSRYLEGKAGLRALRLLTWCVVLAAAVTSGLYVAAILGANVTQFDPFMFIGQSSYHSAMYFLVVIAGVLHVSLRRGRRAFLLFLFPIWAALIITGIRGVWVGALAAVLAFGFISRRIMEAGFALAAAVLTFVILTASTQSYLAHAGDETLISTGRASAMTLAAASLAAKTNAAQGSQKFSEELTSAGRLGYWMAGIRMWMSSPIFGVGPGNFASRSEAFSAKGPRRDAETTFDAHNMFVSILAEFGMLGFGALLAAVFIPLYSGRKLLRESWTSREGLALIGSAFIGLTVAGLTWDIHVQRVWWISLGLLWGSTAHACRQESEPAAAMAPKVQTVLVTLRYGLVARSLFRTGFLDTLRAAGLRVVFVCPAAREEYLIKEIAGANVTLEPFPQIRIGAVESIFEAATDTLLFDHPGTTFTMTVKWRRLFAERQLGSFFWKAVAAPFSLHRSGLLRRLAERVDRRMFRHSEVAAVLDRYRPDLVVTTDLFSSENHFIREASQRGLPSVCLVKSWDNLTSKSRIRVHPDWMVVWSERQRTEASHLHFYPADRVNVLGAPNFDLFKQVSLPQSDRAEFMRSIGADPADKLIVYSPGYKLTNSDDANLHRIHSILHSDRLPYRCHLHVRKYPKSPQDFSHLLHLPGFSVENAGHVVESWGDRVDQPREEMLHLGELMCHADVLIHIGSTIAIDACCFNTPIIGYFLDSTDPASSHNDYPPHVFNLTHNRYLVDLGCQRVVTTEEELVQGLRLYLEHPGADAEGRRATVETICGRFDGRSARRAADFLMSLLPSLDPSQTAPKSEHVSLTSTA